MLYLRLASALYTWRTYPSSVWTRWVSRHNPRFLARSVPGYAVLEAGFIPGGHIHPLYGRSGFQDSTRGCWQGPLLTILHLMLASVLHTRSTYPSSVWTRWVSRLNPRFLARSFTDYAAPEAGFSTVYLEDVSILRMDEVGFKTQPEVSGEVYS
jgi:hypothetical protein